MGSAETQGQLSFIERVPTQAPDWADFMHMRFPNSYSNDWSVPGILTGHSRTILIGWYGCYGGQSCTE